MSDGKSARIVVIGGGVIGLGIAYHLAKLGTDDVLLIERNLLTSGTSWHAAGIVGPLRASMNLTRLAIYATSCSPPRGGDGPGHGLPADRRFLAARNADRMHELHRIAAMGEMAGSNAGRPCEEVAAKVPMLHVADLVGALWSRKTSGQSGRYLHGHAKGLARAVSAFAKMSPASASRRAVGAVSGCASHR